MIESYIGVMTVKRTANMLGALALALADQMKQATEARLGQGGETPAALATLGHEPGLSVDMLRRILGLTHSGGVRLVDRLAADGLVEKRHGQDGRTLALHLTKEGMALRSAVLLDRAKPIEAALQNLPALDLESLSRILEKLLYALCGSELQAYAICRLCDDLACENCPVERACDDA